MLSITAGTFRIKATESLEVKQHSSVAFSRLRKFLESPLQSTASHLLGLAEDEEDVSEKVDEPLVLVRLSEWLLLRKVWNMGLNVPAKGSQQKSHPEWQKLYLFQAQRMELQGEMPTGIFGEAMQIRHLRILKNWQKQLTAVLETDWNSLQKNLSQFYFGAVRKGKFNKGLIGTDRILPAVNIKKETPEPSDSENIVLQNSRRNGMVVHRMNPVTGMSFTSVSVKVKTNPGCVISWMCWFFLQQT